MIFSCNLRRNTNAFQDTGQSDERLGISHTERVHQLHRRSDSRSTKSTRQEADVGLFVKVDLFEVGVKWVWEAGRNELRLGVVGKTFLVELALQILQRQGIVEDCRQPISKTVMVENLVEPSLLMPSSTTGVLTVLWAGAAAPKPAARPTAIA